MKRHAYTSMCTHSCNLMQTHIHIQKRQSLNTQMISHQCDPHTCTTFRSFPWPLFAYALISGGVGACGEGFASSSLLQFPSGLDFGKMSAVLTVNLPTCRNAAILQRKQCVSLSTGHFRYFQRWRKTLEQMRCQLEKNSSQWGEETHCISELFCS